MPWLAPCAPNGSIGCAASPISMIRSVPQLDRHPLLHYIQAERPE
jgi:hypothetical protein